MRAGHADGLRVAGDASQKCGTLHHLETAVAEIGEDMVVGGHRGSVYDERLRLVAELLGDGGRVVGVCYLCAFFFEGACEVGRSEVITGHAGAARQEVAHQVGHAYAAGAYEVE